MRPVTRARKRSPRVELHERALITLDELLQSPNSNRESANNTILGGILRTLLRTHPGEFQHVHVVCSNEAYLSPLFDQLQL